MRIVFQEDRMQIVCEDARDRAFLEANLKIKQTGKVFAKMSMYESRYDDMPMIEVFPYLDKEKRDEKRARRDAAMQADDYVYEKDMPEEDGN